MNFRVRMFVKSTVTRSDDDAGNKKERFGNKVS